MTGPNASDLLKDMTTAYMKEIKATLHMKPPPDFAGAAAACHDAIAALDHAKTQLVPEGATQSEVKSVSKPIDRAKEYDAQCESAANASNKDGVLAALKIANKAKEKAGQKMNKYGLIP